MQSTARESRFMGCLLGLALGDAMGARYEGGPLERAMWRVIGRTRGGHMRWTDDTQMALDVAESLIEKPHLDQDDIARRFADGYRWSRGYGPGAARLLQQVRRGVDWRVANSAVFPQGSFGNGAAMRAPVIGLSCVTTPSALVTRAKASAVVTHAHPLGQEAAVLIAQTTLLSYAQHEPLEIVRRVQSHAEHEAFATRLETVRGWLEAAEVEAALVRKHLGNGITATESCVTAIYLALRFVDAPFDQLLAFTAACGGDVDTIGAMAGAIWGARNGVEALPLQALQRLEQAERIRYVARGLCEVFT